MEVTPQPKRQKECAEECPDHDFISIARMKASLRRARRPTTPTDQVETPP